MLMNILLSIEYYTKMGDELVVNVINDEAGGLLMPHRMTTDDGRLWTCMLSLPIKAACHISYFYSVVQGEGRVLCSEWHVQPHRLELNGVEDECYIVCDRWVVAPADTYSYSTAVTDVLRKRTISSAPQRHFRKTVRLKVRATQLSSTERLVLVGSDRALGGWDVAKALPMYEHDYNEWIADIDAATLTSSNIEMKFVAVDIAANGQYKWEEGSNRMVQISPQSDRSVLVIELPPAEFNTEPIRCAGTLVPVFSLRSRSSFGVGDFGDLRKMIDWVAQTQQRVLQVLPINDTTTTHTWTDSYPYNSISIFALHPQYADLTALPPFNDAEKREKFEALRQELNALPQIDYERVNEAKTAYLAAIYEQEGRRMMGTTQYKAFFKAAAEWLVPYAHYCFLREHYGTSDTSKWTGHHVFNENDRKSLSTATTAACKKVAFYYFVQFILDAQMTAVHDYARSKGVVLKGDIPIGVNRNGCDVWHEPHYFNLNGQAGAPPDYFSVNGQNWGFPTYNWDEMMRDGCRWWLRRFSNMSRFFDAYRIDHVLGFFRIWEIPIHSVHGLLGQFSPSLGMTREEIEDYGLHFREEHFTEPFIADWVIERMFGDRAAMVRQTYLESKGNGLYRMRNEYDTQRKVEAAFADKTSQDDITLRDGLYSLISDVLFVRDLRDPNKFHPRICVQYDYIYESLYDSDKSVFNVIYNEYYYRRNNHFWYREAMKKLPKIVEATRMLACAEDLGMVPDCVSWVMDELRILSLELQSMPKDPSVRFGILERNPYRSVCTISSHDMPTLRQWWDEDDGRTQDYYNSMLCTYGVAPHPLPGWLARDIIARHLQSPSMLCILSIQDWLSVDEHLRLADADAERINIPSNPRHYWRYRMHVNIEDLIANDDFNQNIISLIREGGRQKM